MNGVSTPWERPLITLVVNIFGGTIVDIKKVG